MQPKSRIELEEHFRHFASVATIGGRWQRSLITGAVFSTGYRLIQKTTKAGILDPGLRVHGASAATFWYKDASRRDWIMPSNEDVYSEIARAFNLEEIVDPFYGPYLRYNEQYGQSRILLPDPDIPPEFVLVLREETDQQVAVATLEELLTYYEKRRLVQKGMYAKVKRRYKRISK